MLSLNVSPGEWNSPNITGQPPPTCSVFTLTQVSESRAALFGGYSGFVLGLGLVLNDLFVVELSRHTVVSVMCVGNFCIEVFMLNFVLVNFRHYKAPKMMITILTTCT